MVHKTEKPSEKTENLDKKAEKVKDLSGPSICERCTRCNKLSSYIMSVCPFCGARKKDRVRQMSYGKQAVKPQFTVRTAEKQKEIDKRREKWDKNKEKIDDKMKRIVRKATGLSEYDKQRQKKGRKYQI